MSEPMTDLPTRTHDVAPTEGAAKGLPRLPDLQVRSKLWIEVDGEAVLGDWRAAILEGIERTGSLAKAAMEMNVPYRTAWQRLKESEKRIGIQLIDTQSGGSEGGGSTLTPAAKELLRRYAEFSGGIEELVNQRFHDAFG